MGAGPASPQAQACGPSEPAADSSFSFTPIKALRAIPHLWERKPSTPFQAGAKSRKLWKRFQTSFSGMKSLETSTMTEQGAFQTAINASRDAGYARGVKRLRVGADEPEKRSSFQMQGPVRSFLETKWEPERGQKRRKLPDAPIDIYDEGLRDNESDEGMKESDVPLISLRSPLKTTIFNDHMNQTFNGVSDPDGAKSPASGAIVQEQCAMINTAANDENRDMAPTPTKVVRDLTQQRKGTLVRSALRSSLDGSDTALLNDFLSKAQAKRAAKAALMDQEGDVTKKVSSAEESPEAEMTTPRSRRALDVLDTNSPSPAKPDNSVTKLDVPVGDEASENEVSKVIMEEEPAPGSPSCRRSTRVKAPTVNPPHVRNTIALRRAKGNEFIFLQRTEAQELALATKKNTRLNRGDAVPPQYVLEALAKEQSEGTSQTEGDRKGVSRSSTRKSVTWNDEQLAEYEDERQSPEVSGDKGNSSSDDVEDSTRSRSASTRPEKRASSQLQESSSNAESGSTPGPANAPTTAPPRSRRLRRLGESAMVSGTPVKTGSGRVSKRSAPSAPTVAVAASAAPSTPTKPRRKLTPKSPSTSTLTAPAAKIAAAAEQSFVSGIPTRSTSTSDGSSESKRSVLQSNAGCTPRRIRVRS
ncbi:hypothetical protein N7507_006218 [Penicillium longicatenatum]|nr:hypothetical protein N7507_006218 [Penicillium longicatenatum]